MDNTILTLQDFMFCTKSTIYIIMVVALLAITGFWLFLAGGDEE